MIKIASNITKLCLFIACFIFFVSLEVEANTLRVPSQYPFIQQAIDAAQNGDTVLVAPGTYDTRISFEGKAITVTSEAGPQQTILDGGRTVVVRFVSGETNSSVLSGFTIQNAEERFGRFEGGIYIENSSPKIIGNIIKNNKASYESGGIGISGNAAPDSFTIIQGNIISNNYTVAYEVGRGAGGIGVSHGASAHILDNVITDNMGELNGGGVSLYNAGNVVIRNNKILRNYGIRGTGISINVCKSAFIVQNLIADNVTDSGIGAGIYVSNNLLYQVNILNNTIANNASFFSGIIILNFGQYFKITNNIIVAANLNQRGIYCVRLSSMVMPDAIRSNNVFSPQGAAYGGAYPDQTGIFGNISADPQFVNAANGDYHIQPGSPSIDTGDNSALNLPVTDLDENVRIFDGDRNGSAIVDMGIYEFGSSPFNLCIQDESSKDVLRINTTTGTYQLTRCRDGFTVGGTATITRRGCTISFQDSRSDRRIMANIDTCQNKATASVQIFALGSIFTLNDRNITNNSCACPNSN